MDTNAPKTPATLPFAAWQAMSPGDAARELHARVAALPEPLRHAALAWLKPEPELAAELADAKTVGASLLATQDVRVASKFAPTTDTARPLSGVPYLLKDLFDLAGVPTKAGSTFIDRARDQPTRDSAIALRLRALGAACAGKTHLVEFAAGLFGDNAHYGDCPHPRFPDRLSGGSSSGSAALVAAGVVPLAIGTDTGGSVRVPAAWCGLFGFRLTARDQLIRDALPLSPTMDTAGWFTANAADMLTAWGAITGSSRRETAGKTSGLTTAATPRGLYLNLRKLLPESDKKVDEACARTAALFAVKADAVTEEALLASWQNAVESYTVTALSEAHAIHRAWLAPYHGHYESSIWQRFSDGGRYTPDQLNYAATAMENVQAVFRQFFATYDYLVLPAVPFPALRKAECTAEARRQLLTLTTPASLAGLPVLSLPVSLPSGLTVGLQVILPAADSPVVPWVLR